MEKKYSKQIHGILEEQHLREAERMQIPAKLKNLQADHASWKTKEEEWKRSRTEEFRANIVRPYDVFPQNGSVQGRMPHVEKRFTFSFCTAFHRKFSRFSTWIFGEINKFSTIRG